MRVFLDDAIGNTHVSVEGARESGGVHDVSYVRAIVLSDKLAIDNDAVRKLGNIFHSHKNRSKGINHRSEKQ